MMRRFAGEDYERFRRKTPFFLPLPKFLTECLTWPTRVLFKKRLPERAGEIAVVLVFYTLVLVGLSVVYARARDLPRIPQAVRAEMPAEAERGEEPEEPETDTDIPSALPGGIQIETPPPPAPAPEEPAPDDPAPEEPEAEIPEPQDAETDAPEPEGEGEEAEAPE